jgi:hypothetical protein
MHTHITMISDYNNGSDDDGFRRTSEEFRLMNRVHDGAFELLGHAPYLVQFLDRLAIVSTMVMITFGVVREWREIYSTAWLSLHISLAAIETYTQVPWNMDFDGKFRSNWHMTKAMHRLYVWMLLLALLADVSVGVCVLRDLAQHSTNEDIGKTIVTLVSACTTMYRILSSFYTETAYTNNIKLHK